MIKRVLVLLTSVLLFISMTIPVYAFEESYDVVTESVLHTAEEKTEFAIQKEKEFKMSKENNEILEYDEAKIMDLLSRAGCATEDELQEINEELEMYGVYEFPTEIVGNNNSTRDSSDVVVNRPVIYHDVHTDRWMVSTGGNWITENYDDRLIITDLNVGDLDAFGVGYTNKSGYDALVVQVTASLYAENGNTITTTNRSDGNGGDGFGFQLQDKYVRVGLGQYCYLGYRWSGVCYYDSDFSTFSATATSYYIHTYSTAVINDITFGHDGKSAGIEMSITNANNSWPAYSNDVRK